MDIHLINTYKTRAYVNLVVCYALYFLAETLKF